MKNKGQIKFRLKRQPEKTKAVRGGAVLGAALHLINRHSQNALYSFFPAPGAGLEKCEKPL
jgi:hypothetical protein